LTYDEFREKFPEEFRKRENDKYHYRFLYGEVGYSIKTFVSEYLFNLLAGMDVN